MTAPPTVHGTCWFKQAVRNPKRGQLIHVTLPPGKLRTTHPDERSGIGAEEVDDAYVAKSIPALASLRLTLAFARKSRCLAAAFPPVSSPPGSSRRNRRAPANAGRAASSICP